jgi:hypothetical protein
MIWQAILRFWKGIFLSSCFPAAVKNSGILTIEWRLPEAKKKSENLYQKCPETCNSFFFLYKVQHLDDATRGRRHSFLFKLVNMGGDILLDLETFHLGAAIFYSFKELSPANIQRRNHEISRNLLEIPDFSQRRSLILTTPRSDGCQDRCTNFYTIYSLHIHTRYFSDPLRPRMFACLPKGVYAIGI